MTKVWHQFESIRHIAEAVCNRAIVTSAIILMTATALVPAIQPAVTYAAPLTVQNPGLETVTGGVPNCFSQSGWGDQTVNWQLVAGRTGAYAQSLTISNYASGDRKLLVEQSDACAPAAVPGKRYDLSVWYTSTAARNFITVFRHSAAGWTYWTDIKQIPATAAWAQASGRTPVVPAGTDQLAFGITLAGNGTLVTDDYGYAETGQTVPAPAAELMTNGNLENGGTPPAGYMQTGWGDGTMTGAVVGGAHSGGRAYSITIANRTSGDYKLLPSDDSAPAVQPGEVYNLSAWYKSTTASNSVTIFAHSASGWGYWTDLKTLPASAGWTQMTAQTPAIPAGVDEIAWGISIFNDGTLVTDDYSMTKTGVTPPPVEGPATQGAWNILDYPMPVRGVHATLLKNGKVLLIAGSGNSEAAFAANSFKVSVWDPVTGTFMTLDVPKDMFCAGHVTLPDGRVLIQGGTKNYPTNDVAANYGGLRDSWIFNPDDNTFTETNMANEGHWYPTLTELGNGDIWMAGGLKEDTTGAVNTEYFNSTTSQWQPTGQIPQTWSYWGLYPHMYLMADGRLFYSGGHTFGDGLPGTGASIYNYQTAQISDVAGLRQKDMRDQSASVLLPPAQDQKVMITGGGNIFTSNPAINLTDIIDLKPAVPAYQPGPNLPGDGKMYVNATILPDRSVLLSNGGQLNRDDSTNVMTAALYDAATNTMKSVPADPIARNYHSTAVLLPDGRVAVFGSNPGDGSFELRISVYSPGYFYRTARPVINNVPAAVTYGQNATFNVNLQGKAIKSAQLLRPMSVTHQTDANLRLVDLPVNVQGGTATVTVPANRNLLPPGPYMLTITDMDGVPSTSSWVMVR